MIKEIKMLTCAMVLASFVSPVSAKLIRLYDLRNYMYMGSTNLGAGESMTKASGDKSSMVIEVSTCDQSLGR